MQEHRTELIVVMRAIEDEMRRTGFWSSEAPSTQALESQEPFCVDTMNFDDWLQWVLIPRMHHLLIKGLPLPSNCAIAPMAEQCWKEEARETGQLIQLIRRFDELLNRPH